MEGREEDITFARRGRLQNPYNDVHCQQVAIVRIDSAGFSGFLIGDSSMLYNTQENRVNLGLRAEWTIAKFDENLGQTPILALTAPLLIAFNNIV